MEVMLDGSAHLVLYRYGGWHAEEISKPAKAALSYDYLIIVLGQKAKLCHMLELYMNVTII